MENDIIDQIDEAQGTKLARYVAGRCSAAEEAAVRAWIAAAPGRAELVESLRRTRELTRRSWAASDVDAAWDELRRRHDARRARRPAASVHSRRRMPARALRIAAALALAVGGAAVWATLVREAPDAPFVAAMREYTTGRGERAQVGLPDGTRVVLSVDSRLRVPEDYGADSREVGLEGEALFEVRHDEQRPFRVHAGGVVVQDLGTVFGVRGYPGDAPGDGAGGAPVTVVVAEGLVEIGGAPSTGPVATHRVEPGQLARVSADGTVRVERGIDPAAYLAFADGRLVFDDTPLREAAAQLGRWYDLDVRLADPSLATLPLTASFQQEPVSSVLNLIALSLGLRYEREGDVVTFVR